MDETLRVGNIVVILLVEKLTEGRYNRLEKGGLTSKNLGSTDCW